MFTTSFSKIMQTPSVCLLRSLYRPKRISVSGSGTGEILITLSFPHRLHLTGRSLISVVGNNHSTVCLPQHGQRKRRRSVFISLSSGFCCMVFCKLTSPHFETFAERKKQKSPCHNRIRDYLAQALRLRRRFSCN